MRFRETWTLGYDSFVALFAHRLTVIPDGKEAPLLPGTYDESMDLRVDRAGRPVVYPEQDCARGDLGMPTRASRDRPRGIVELGTVTREGPDRDEDRMVRAARFGREGKDRLVCAGLGTVTRAGRDADR